MSRSYRNRPYAPICGSGASQKSWKRVANRTLRKRVREELLHGREDMPVLREVSNVYTWPQDGTRRWSSLAQHLMRAYEHAHWRFLHGLTVDPISDLSWRRWTRWK